MLHLFTSMVLSATVGDARPPELGRVDFGRDLERGFVLARESSKPIFLLFQEIPG